MPPSSRGKKRPAEERLRLLASPRLGQGQGELVDEGGRHARPVREALERAHALVRGVAEHAVGLVRRQVQRDVCPVDVHPLLEDGERGLGVALGAQQGQAEVAVEDRDPGVEAAGLLPLAHGLLGAAAGEEQRALEEAGGRVRGVALERAPQHRRGVGAAREDVGRAEARRGLEVGPRVPARLLAAVAAVVGDQRVVLGQDVAGLGHGAARGVAPREELEGLVVEAQAHQLARHVQDALGVSREVRPQRLVLRAQPHGLVAEVRARGIQLAPVREARAGLVRAPEPAQQRDLRLAHPHRPRATRPPPREPARAPARARRGEPPRAPAPASPPAGRPGRSAPSPSPRGPPPRRPARRGRGRGSSGPRGRC